MVKSLRISLAFFRLLRWQNLLIIALSMLLLRWFVMIPLLKYSGFETQISTWLFICITLAVCSIAAGGYVINDYFDRKHDLINRPGTVIVGRIITRRAAMLWHIILTICGIAIGTYASWILGLVYFSLIYLFVAVLLWFYSTSYKRQLLLGNFVVALIIAFVPAMLLVYELPLVVKKYTYDLTVSDTGLKIMLYWFIAYIALAFLVNLIREIIKDIEDREGDAAFDRKTIPIVLGVNSARNIALSLQLITILLIVLILNKYINNYISLAYISGLIILPLIYTSIRTLLAKHKADFHHISSALKIIMVSALIYSIVYNHFILNTL